MFDEIWCTHNTKLVCLMWMYLWKDIRSMPAKWISSIDDLDPQITFPGLWRLWNVFLRKKENLVNSPRRHNCYDNNDISDRRERKFILTDHISIWKYYWVRPLGPFLSLLAKKHTTWVIRWLESITVILVQLEKDFNNHTKMTVIKIHQSQTIMICSWIGTFWKL